MMTMAMMKVEYSHHFLRFCAAVGLQFEQFMKIRSPAARFWD